MWRDAAIALSLANLCLVKVWGRIVFYGDADAFHMKCVPGSVEVLAAAANTGLLWAAIWILIRALRSDRRGFTVGCKLGLLAAVLMALNSIRAILAGQFPELRGALLASLGTQVQIGCVITFAALVTVALFVAGPRMRRFGVVTLLVLAPLTVVTLFGAAIQLIWAPRHELAIPALRPRTTGQMGRNRVVWVIFDEWDYHTAFENRPKELRTPNLDRLAKECLSATKAYPPGADTLRSIPSLLVGEVLSDVKKVRPADLLLSRPEVSAPVRWSADLTVLARARENGFNTAAAGWYLPYCRLLAPALTACHWCEMARAEESCEAFGNPLWRSMAGQMRSVFETTQFSLLGQSQGFEGHARSYRELLEAGASFAADPELGFVFLHLPVPHAPFLRGGPGGAFGSGDYADSLTLVDQTVGRLVDAMAAGGVWRSTHLLLSSDHSLRRTSHRDLRVPFLLRLAGDELGRVYSNRLSTVASGELLMRALNGEIATYEAAANWLDARPR